MVKLIHFQCYPDPLLPVMVTHVPSMHICLKFIPELVTQPQTDKQVLIDTQCSCTLSSSPLLYFSLTSNFLYVHTSLSHSNISTFFYLIINLFCHQLTSFLSTPYTHTQLAYTHTPPPPPPPSHSLTHTSPSSSLSNSESSLPPM